MIPEKQKAIELVEKFMPKPMCQSNWEFAKDNALIAVDEILAACEHLLPYRRNEIYTAVYWHNVKTEIEKL